ncbi:MAG: 2OG-Fe(II) oxygenase [Phormidesmis sp.]
MTSQPTLSKPSSSKLASEQTPALSTCFDQGYMDAFDRSEFISNQPYPWANFKALLTPQAFAALYQEFPALDFFEKHEGMARKYDQKPHDRYYLAYEEKIDAYKKLDSEQEAMQGKGVIRHSQLSPTWQTFISEITSDSGYRRFIGKLLGTDEFITRFAWHVATAGHSVSPHSDARNKLGTHIFYFNTTEDWQADWGGATLVLDEKNYEGMNPTVSDFGKVTAVEVMNNRSFLFKNQVEGWHAVDTLKCPVGVHRRIFNVIVEIPKQKNVEKVKATVKTTLREKLLGWL